MSDFKKAGFTLLELSIVIVIIGLIVAGISAGQSLVTQANLRSIITDKDKYTVMINSFYMQYDALPGDMVNAQSYWGVSVDNGDGDRSIEWVTTPREVFMAWQHLGAAGLVDDTYASTPDYAVVGTNVPAASFNGSCWSFADGDAFPAGYLYATTTTLNLGVPGPSADHCVRVFYTPAQAYSIDVKVDDGLITSGTMMARVDQNASCTDGSAYNLDETGNVCSSFFVLDR